MWPLYALLTALLIATSDAFAKQAMQQGATGPRLLFLRYVVSIPLLLPFLAAGIPTLDATFWKIHPVWIPLETTALYLYMRAIRVSPLSLTLPFLALTPAFLLITGRLLIGERIAAQGVAGILLIVIGSYVIHLREALRHPLAPFAAIAREPGSRLMVIVAALYSVTSICGKVLVGHSSATYFSVHYAVVMSLVLAPAGLWGWHGQAAACPWEDTGDSQQPKNVPTRRRRYSLIAAFTFSGSILFHMLAIQLAPVASMIALKRFSVLFGVLYGRLMFRETGVGSRLAGAALMLIGGGLIVAGRG